MSLLHFDGFDQYALLSDLINYGGWSNGNNYVPSSTVRIGAGKSMFGSGANNYLTKLVANQAGKTIYAGFAFARAEAGLGRPIFHVDHSNASTDPQCMLVVNTLNKLELRLGDGTLLASGSTVLGLSVFYYIEVKALVANSGGVFEVRINNTVEATYTGDTQAAADNAVMGVTFGGNSNNNSSMNGYIDDIYILNSDGAINNTYLGEQRCIIMNPTADNSITWSRNTGTSNFAEINQTAPGADGDTTYVFSSTSGQKDMYGYSGVSGIAAAAGVKVVTRAEKDDVNPLSLKTGVKSGTVDQQNTYILPQGYTNFIDIFETSDGAGTAWTSTAVNSLLSTIQIP